MKKSMLFAAVLFLTLPALYGQGNKEKNELDTRRHGLLFEVEGLNRLGVGPYGCGIGKKMFCGDYAVRPTLAFSTFKSTENPGLPDYVGDTDSRTKIGIDLDFLKQRNTPSRLQLYYGVGIGYEMQKGKREPAHESQATVSKTDSSGSTLRARAIVGMEYFLNKHISLSGEYQLGYDHTILKSKTTYGTTASPELKTTISDFKIRTGPRLTLGLYF